MSVPAANCEFNFKRLQTTGGESGVQYMFTGVRESSTSLKMYEAGTPINSNVNTDSGAVPANYYCSFARGLTTTTAGDFTSGTSKFESFGALLTATDVSNLHTLVHAYQTALGRQGA